MTRPYAILDVFTKTPLAGNPLAVVLDGAALDGERMQAIAREFNLSETVFVIPPDNRVHSARIRIFTPGRELPFAGHPTVGTAVLLAARKLAEGAGKEQMLILEEAVGAIRCGVFLKDGNAGHAIFDLPRLPQPVAREFDRDMVAAALGLLPTEVGFENHVCSSYDAGVPYAFVPVRDLAVANRAAPQAGRAWTAAFGQDSHPNAYVYCRQTEGGAGRHFHGRMFAPGFGISEDPATGSAVAAFAGVIGKFDAPPSGAHRYVIEQGFEMGRPSLITLEMDVEKGALAAARIGGDAVVVAEGTLAL